MRLALGCLLALGCVDEPKTGRAAAEESGTPPAPEDTALPTSDPDPSDTGLGEDAPATHALARVAAGAFASTAGGVVAARMNPINGYTYLLDPGQEEVLYLTQAKVNPTGDWCIEPACSASGVYTAGRISLEGVGTGMCLDLDRGQLNLPQTSGRVWQVDVDPSGESASTYHRVSGFLSLPSVAVSVAPHVGPCVHIPALDALLVTSPSTGSMALIDIESEGLRAMTGGVEGVSWAAALADGSRVVLGLPESDAIGVVSLPLLELTTVQLDAPVVDIALDRETNRIWIAHGASPGLSVLSLDDLSLGAVPIEGAPSCTQVAVAADAGLVLATAPAGGPGASFTEVVLIEDGAIVDRDELFVDVLDVAEPTDRSDFVVIVQEHSGSTGFIAYDAVRPPQPGDPPPLHAFVMTAIELPTDDDLAAIEKGFTSCALIDNYVALIDQNSAALASLDLKVAVGITHNFVKAVDLCGHRGVLWRMEALGFDLGYLVHNRPAYNCTDSPGEPLADTCPRTDLNHCDPAREQCAFPGDADYCALGDQACYQRYLDAHAVYTEKRFPSRFSFVAGADRHGFWEWDWVQAYQNLARADGRRGVFTSLFVHLWSYSDQIDFTDARGKNTAPWDAHARSEAWAIGYADAWDRHSVFSDLMYLPGLTTSLIKLGEQHRTGLFMLDLFQTSTTIRYEEDDFAVLQQLMRNALDSRGQIGPNALYFHLHDLSTLNLMDALGVEQPALEYLRAWAENTNRVYVDPGHMLWATPSEIRAEWESIR